MKQRLQNYYLRLLLMTAAMALMYKELTRKKLRGEGRES